MAVIGIVIGTIFALVGGALINSLLDKAGIETDGGSIFSGLSLSNNDKDEGGKENEKSGGLLSGILGGSGGESAGSEYEELGELGDILGALGALSGEEVDMSALEGLMGNIEQPAN